MDSRSVAYFWRWFSENQARLDDLGRDSLVDQVLAELQKIDDGVGVEVSAKGQPPELVLTAYGEPSLFPLVRQIVAAAPVNLAWTVRALKPPSGFDFCLRRGEASIDASTLPFEPLEAEADPQLLGLQVFVPTQSDPEADWLSIVKLILASGLGEEGMAQVSHVEFDDIANAADDLLRLAELAAFLDWRRRRPPPDQA